MYSGVTKNISGNSWRLNHFILFYNCNHTMHENPWEIYWVENKDMQKPGKVIKML